MASQITLRPAAPTDAPAIAALGAATFTYSFAWSMPPADLAAYLASSYAPAVIRAEIEDAEQNVWRVAVSTDSADAPAATTAAGSGNGQEVVVGFVQLKRGSTEPCLPPGVRLMDLHRLYVSTRFHGRGVGRRLIAAGLDIARSEVWQGAKWEGAWLGVWQHNPGAQKLYKSHGFERVGERDFVMGECIQTDDVLVLRF